MVGAEKLSLFLVFQFFGQVQSNESTPSTPKSSSSSEIAAEKLDHQIINNQGLNTSENVSHFSNNDDLIRPKTETTSLMSMPPSSTESTLRHRVPTPRLAFIQHSCMFQKCSMDENEIIYFFSEEDKRNGRVQITLRYSDNRNKFVVVVHKAL